MTFKVYILGGDEAASASPGPITPSDPAERAATLHAALRGMPEAEIQVAAATLNGNLADTLRELLAEDAVLGVELPSSMAREAALLCGGLSSYALHSGLATAVVRRGQREARLVARDLLAKAIVAALREAGVTNVRTALILGAGTAARSSMAALHEVGCNRFLIGYGDPRRVDELGRQVAHWKKQVHYFPLHEMGEFFAWAIEHEAYEAPYAGTAATEKEHKLRAEREDRQDPRRWELVINATPVGNPGVEPANLLPDRRFLSCTGRVMDFSGNGVPTALVSLATEMSLPTIDLPTIIRHWSAEALRLWQSEALRRIEGAPEEPEHHPRQEQRRFVLKRR